MSEHIALYRKWRPLTFSDVIGQEHITKTLQNEITSKKAGHAFLFCGGRGTGKTSTARILSRALNCVNPKENGDPCNECEICRGILSGEIMDIVEIDAASNNGVDNIRDLRSEARYAASTAKAKVYIIDEVHMLSSGAFNALLKLLEEPPENVIFILATTETQKVPATILSRCQRFDFKRITANDIAKRVLYIAEKEGIEIDEKVAHLIARSADGALRDALSLLDQLSALSGKITAESVYNLLGLTDKAFLYRVCRFVATNDVAGAIGLLDEYIASGKSAAKFIDSMVDYFTTLLRYRVSESVFSDYTEEEKKEIAVASSEMSRERLMYSIETLIKCAQSLKFMSSDRVLLDVALMKLCTPTYSEDSEALALRIAELELAIERGVIATSTTQKAEVKKDNAPKPKKKIAPKSEECKLILDKWADMKKDTSNVMLLVALNRATIREEDATIVLVFEEKDAIMLDMLKDEAIKGELIALVEKHTGFSPRIIERLASYYEDFDEVEENDPLSTISTEEVEEVHDTLEEAEEEYEFEENDIEEEEF